MADQTAIFHIELTGQEKLFQFMEALDKSLKGVKETLNHVGPGGTQEPEGTPENTNETEKKTDILVASRLTSRFSALGAIAGSATVALAGLEMTSRLAAQATRDMLDAQMAGESVGQLRSWRANAQGYFNEPSLRQSAIHAHNNAQYASLLESIGVSREAIGSGNANRIMREQLQAEARLFNSTPAENREAVFRARGLDLYRNYGFLTANPADQSRILGNIGRDAAGLETSRGDLRTLSEVNRTNDVTREHRNAVAMGLFAPTAGKATIALNKFENAVLDATGALVGFAHEHPGVAGAIAVGGGALGGLAGGAIAGRTVKALLTGGTAAGLGEAKGGLGLLKGMFGGGAARGVAGRAAAAGAMRIAPVFVPGVGEVLMALAATDIADDFLLQGQGKKGLAQLGNMAWDAVTGGGGGGSNNPDQKIDLTGRRMTVAPGTDGTVSTNTSARIDVVIRNQTGSAVNVAARRGAGL